MTFVEQNTMAVVNEILAKYPSYPYLGIARELDADYGHVLQFADLISGKHIECDADGNGIAANYWQIAACDAMGATIKKVIMAMRNHLISVRHATA